MSVTADQCDKVLPGKHNLPVLLLIGDGNFKILYWNLKFNLVCGVFIFLVYPFRGPLI